MTRHVVDMGELRPIEVKPQLGSLVAPAESPMPPIPSSYEDLRSQVEEEERRNPGFKEKFRGFLDVLKKPEAQAALLQFSVSALRSPFSGPAAIVDAMAQGLQAIGRVQERRARAQAEKALLGMKAEELKLKRDKLLLDALGKRQRAASSPAKDEVPIDDYVEYVEMNFPEYETPGQKMKAAQALKQIEEDGAMSWAEKLGYEPKELVDIYMKGGRNQVLASVEMLKNSVVEFELDEKGEVDLETILAMKEPPSRKAVLIEGLLNKAEPEEQNRIMQVVKERDPELYQLLIRKAPEIEVTP